MSVDRIHVRLSVRCGVALVDSSVSGVDYPSHLPSDCPLNFGTDITGIFHYHMHATQDKEPSPCSSVEQHGLASDGPHPPGP